jgi:hypothetical protein
MALPEKVIEQIGREPSETQGWGLGALLLSGGIFFLTLVIYVGLVFGYEPYLQSQLTSEKNQVNQLQNSISPSDQTQLIDFYSQIANLQSLLQNHALSSQLFTWLEKNTEANISYQSFSLTQGGHVSLTATAATEADANQQIAIFEASPQVSAVSISGINAPSISGGGWSFGATLTMDPSLFLASSQ